MHVSFILKEFPVGGIGTATIDVANYLAAQGCRVTILTQEHLTAGYPHGYNRDFAVEMLPNGSFSRSLVVAQYVADFIRREQVNVLVAPFRAPHYIGWLRRRVDIKVVFMLHSMPFYEVGTWENMQRTNKIKRILKTICGTRLQRWFYVRRKYRPVYQQVDAYGVLCEGYKQAMIRALKLNPADNHLYVLPNGITLPSPSLAKTHTVLYMGRLTHSDKRVDRLLRIWAEASRELPDWTLKIVGDGTERPNLEKMAAELALERVSFEGWTDQVGRYFNEAAVACMTSSFEGWPLSVAEAQAYGVVPILFNSFTGAKELVSNADEGILIPPFDEHAYAKALAELCRDDARRASMQQAVLRKARQYTVERACEAWLRMLHSLCPEKA